MKIVLASKSPRRQTILREAGLTFATINTGTPIPGFAIDDEPQLPDETPFDYVSRTAREKAIKAFAMIHDDDHLVIAADTVVEIDGHVLGKPEDSREATRFLQTLSGRVHHVLTAVAVGKNASDLTLRVDVASVTFKKLTPEQIDAYVKTDEPYDKAGGYAIQGKAGAFIEKVEGDPLTVIGLPLRVLKELLATYGL
ncbi:MAG TPA: septum formation protein Maf [Sutterella sp.]|nr:septum formation protein Maf [Sutterella sp.]